ncbi:MAG: methionyl-tRNA formyltransferase [Pseudomonas fluorescens]|nr:MAG: methionyl-tRNA formyltransferase [Pseudomonas fluorescens]
MAKVVFMGSPAFAVPSLRALHADNNEIIAVYTQPPRPAGRGMNEKRSDVHEAAMELGIPVFFPEKLRGDELEKVMALDADVFCVVAYGLLLPKVMVDEKLCLNVHPSRLPRWRGAAPLQWTLMSGDPDTDICVMKLDAGMDTGPVVARERVAIPHDMTLGQLHDLTAVQGAEMLADVVRGLPDIRLVEQEGEATLAPKIDNVVRAIDWKARAFEVHNKVRGLNPVPSATALFDGETLKILACEIVDGFGATGEILSVDAAGVVVGCGEGTVRITRLQRPGSKAMAASDAARGWPALTVGAKFA